MQKILGIGMAAAGLILLIAPLPFFGNEEVREWYPAFFIVGGPLAWLGIKKCTDE